ncbi:hypothetical protein PENTCL1PPCAC_22288, partial [Pristionchus entomophagus]
LPMVNYLSFVFTLLFSGATYCAVNFKKSLILDEFDLSGQDSVSLDSVCHDNGCKVYVSSVKDATFIDKLTFKPSLGEEVGLKSYTYDFDSKTRLKIPYVVKKGISISVKNTNENLFVGPIVVYVVNSKAPRIRLAGVYDVAQGYREEQTIGKIVTVMGPRPFTVWASSPSSPEKLEAFVYTTGFDVDYEGEWCTEALHSTLGEDIQFAVNGPIASITFLAVVPLNVQFQEVFETKLDLPTATFITSPGFIGCGNAEVYQSSLYDSLTNFILSSDIAQITYMEIFVNTEDPLILQIDSNPGMERDFTGSIGPDHVNNTYTNGLIVSARVLSFSYSTTDPDSYFMVKFDYLGVAPVTEKTVPPTSSISSDGFVSTDTTEAFQVSTSAIPPTRIATTRQTLPPASSTTLSSPSPISRTVSPTSPTSSTSLIVSTSTTSPTLPTNPTSPTVPTSPISSTSPAVSTIQTTTTVTPTTSAAIGSSGTSTLAILTALLFTSIYYS